MLRRKFYKRLLIIYLAFTLVYGFTISSFFVFQNKKTIDKENLDSTLTTITQQSRNIDQKIINFVKYVDTLYLDSQFKQFLLNDSNYYNITNLFEKLSRDMSVFSDIEARITVSLVSDDLYISNQGTMNEERFMMEFGIDEQKKAAISNFYKNGNNRDYIIMEDISDTYILFATINIYSGSERILVIQSINKNKLATLENDKYLNILINSDDKDNYRIEKNRLIYLKRSHVLPSVIYEFNFPYKKTSIFSIQFFTAILIYLAIVAIGSFLATFIARSTYKPILNIMENFEVDNEEKQDEFAFLSKITQDIKKANNELKTTLIEQKIDLKTKVLRDLINGISHHEHISFINNDDNLKQLNYNSRVVLINIEEGNYYNEFYLSDARNKIRNNIYTIIESVLTLETYFFEIIELNSNQLAIIISSIQNETIEQLLVKMLKLIEAEDKVNIVFVVGQEVDTLINLKSSYQSTLKILDFRSNFDKRAIIFYSEMKNISLKSFYFYPVDIERELIIGTLQGNYNKIEQIFSQIYQINFVEHCIDSNEKRKLIINMTGTLRRVYQKMLNNNEKNEEFELLNLFENNRYQEDEIYNRLKITFLNFSDIVRQRSRSKAIEYSTEMLKYIKEHYNKDISLEEVATHLNLSTAYFSTIFKKETGENFKTYLNKYRVEKAKEFLCEKSSMKIKDLSIKVGYFNVNSFIRMFKKYEGVSPGEYAKGINKSL